MLLLPIREKEFAVWRVSQIPTVVCQSCDWTDVELSLAWPVKTSQPVFLHLQYNLQGVDVC